MKIKLEMELKNSDIAIRGSLAVRESVDTALKRLAYYSYYFTQECGNRILDKNGNTIGEISCVKE